VKIEEQDDIAREITDYVGSETIDTPEGKRRIGGYVSVSWQLLEDAKIDVIKKHVKTELRRMLDTKAAEIEAEMVYEAEVQRWSNGAF